MKCLIVDDEEMAIQVIENHLQFVQGMEVVGRYHNAMEAFSALQSQKIDLMFLDIEMPKMTGLSLLRSLKNRPWVILTTAHREFALEGYDLDVIDYLLKPIALDRFLQAVAKVFRWENLQEHRSHKPQHLETPTESPSFFYIKSERQYTKILLEEMLYIESIRNHVKIVTTSGVHTTLMGISQLEEKLPPQHFIRIHRSYIVATSKIRQFSPSELSIGDKILSIGSLYRQEVLRRLQKDLI